MMTLWPRAGAPARGGDGAALVVTTAARPTDDDLTLQAWRGDGLSAALHPGPGPRAAQYARSPGMGRGDGRMTAPGKRWRGCRRGDAAPNPVGVLLGVAGGGAGELRRAPGVPRDAGILERPSCPSLRARPETGYVERRIVTQARDESVVAPSSGPWPGAARGLLKSHPSASGRMCAWRSSRAPGERSGRGGQAACAGFSLLREALGESLRPTHDGEARGPSVGDGVIRRRSPSNCWIPTARIFRRTGPLLGEERPLLGRDELSREGNHRDRSRPGIWRRRVRLQAADVRQVEIQRTMSGARPGPASVRLAVRGAHDLWPPARAGFPAPPGRGSSSTTRCEDVGAVRPGLQRCSAERSRFASTGFVSQSTAPGWAPVT